MATITNSTMSGAVAPATTAIAFDNFMQDAGVMPMLFGQRAIGMVKETIVSSSGLAKWQEKGELVAGTESTPVQQFTKDIIPLEYAQVVPIERKFIDDERFGVVAQLANKLGVSAFRTMESNAAAVFNNAFTTTLSEDALSLCNGAHLNASGGNSQSNSGTTALSPAAVSATRDIMAVWTDYLGEEIVVVPDSILIRSGALEETLFEIINSDKKPDSQNNNVNFHRGKYTGIVWKYLSDANNWFMLDSRMAEDNLLWAWRVPLEYYSDSDLFVGKRRLGGYFRAKADVIDWRWVYGHNVA